MNQKLYISLSDPSLLKSKKNNLILNMLSGLKWEDLTEEEKELFNEKERKELEP